MDNPPHDGENGKKQHATFSSTIEMFINARGMLSKLVDVDELSYPTAMQCSEFVHLSMGWICPAGLWRSQGTLDWTESHPVRPMDQSLDYVDPQDGDDQKGKTPQV